MTESEVFAFAQEIASSPAGDGQSPDDIIQTAKADLLRPEFEPIAQTDPNYWQAVYDRIDANASQYYGSWD